MERSEKINSLSKALFIFHSEMGKIAKTSSNPFFKSKYADLPTILDAINEPLQKAGLVIVSIPDGEGLTSILIHSESGEYISANAIMKPVKNDPQSIGSAITYQRRYSIGSMLNLNIDNDDDGNLASGKGVKTDNTTKATNEAKDCKDLKDLEMVWNRYAELHNNKQFIDLINSMKVNISKLNK